MEGSAEYVEQIRRKFHPVLAAGQLRCKQAFITRENINALLREAGPPRRPDLLSIDIDGNDYYVWQAVTEVDARVVVIEYNGKFPPDCDWKMAYDPNHIWDGSDWHGASLKALELLGAQRGYQLVGTNLSGANAFFVKKELAGELFCQPATAQALYNPLRLGLKHRNGHPARYCLRGQAEGLGVLNYAPGVKAVPGYGFHEIERDGTKEHCWTAAPESRLTVRRSPGDTCLRLPCTVPQCVLERCGGRYPVRVAAGQAPAAEYFVTENSVLEIPLPPVEEACVCLTLSAPCLWSPAEVSGSADTRRLGVSVCLSGITTG